MPARAHLARVFRAGGERLVGTGGTVRLPPELAALPDLYYQPVPPAEPVLYFLYYDYGPSAPEAAQVELCYIGRGHLRSRDDERAYEWRRTGRRLWDACCYVRCPPACIAAAEDALIYLLRPTHNVPRCSRLHLDHHAALDRIGYAGPR